MEEEQLTEQEGVYVDALTLVKRLKAMKTAERSEANRRIAIATTEAEKLAAYILAYLVTDQDEALEEIGA